MRIRRNEDEIRRVVEEYRTRGLSRVEYCRRSGVALSTLSNYCRRQKSSGLILVNVEDAGTDHTRYALV